MVLPLPTSFSLQRLLVLETGGQQVHVCVAQRAHADAAWQRWEHTGPGGAAASAHLIPAVIALLNQSGLALSDLDAIAFGQGPGSFTGLRSACAVAQGLAISACPNGLPLIPVPSLWGLAQTAQRLVEPSAGTLIWSCLDARMGEIYAASYGALGPDRVPVCQAEEALYSPEALIHAIQEGCPRDRSCVVVGNANALLQPLLCACPQVVVLETEVLASDMVEVASQLATQGGMVAAEAAMPLYVRNKVALTTIEREALKASSAS